MSEPTIRVCSDEPSQLRSLAGQLTETCCDHSITGFEQVVAALNATADRLDAETAEDQEVEALARVLAVNHFIGFDPEVGVYSFPASGAGHDAWIAAARAARAHLIPERHRVIGPEVLDDVLALTGWVISQQCPNKVRDRASALRSWLDAEPMRVNRYDPSTEALP